MPTTLPTLTDDISDPADGISDPANDNAEPADDIADHAESIAETLPTASPRPCRQHRRDPADSIA